MVRVLLIALLVALALHRGACQGPQGIIRISNGRFVDDTCREYKFSGWNGWNFLDYAVSNPSYITAKYQAAQASSLNMQRIILLGGNNDGGADLLSGPGQLDERVAKGLDFILAEASKYGIKLTLAFINLWKPGGVPLMEQWCGTSGTTVRPHPELELRPGSGLNETERLQTPYAWLTSSACRQQVKDLITAVVNRRNTLTDVIYKDDPTIFSWNLMNEPRCKYCGPDPVDSWYGEMAQHLKSEDPNHLVTTGEEGFFDESDPMSAANPTDGNLWASRSGQSFRANHHKAGVDYAVIHLWPDNWRKPPYDPAWGRQWIDAHSQVASQLGLPLVLEEFGKNAGDGDITSVRDPWFEMVHDAVTESMRSGGPLRGALFWQWDGESGPRPDNSSDIRQYDSTFTTITTFAQSLADSPQESVPGCAPRASGAPPLTVVPSGVPVAERGSAAPAPLGSAAGAAVGRTAAAQFFQTGLGPGGSRKLLRGVN